MYLYIGKLEKLPSDLSGEEWRCRHTQWARRAHGHCCAYIESTLCLQWTRLSFEARGLAFLHYIPFSLHRCFILISRSRSYLYSLYHLYLYIHFVTCFSSRLSDAPDCPLECKLLPTESEQRERERGEGCLLAKKKKKQLLRFDHCHEK